MKSWIVGSALALAVGVVAGTSQGATVDLNSLWNSGGFLGVKDGSLNAKITVGTSTTNVPELGAYEWTVAAASNDAPFTTGAIVYTYCIQAFQYFYPSSNPSHFTIDSLVGSPTGLPDQNLIDADKAGKIQTLINQHWDEAIADSTGVKAATFQAAIWEIEYGINNVVLSGSKANDVQATLSGTNGWLVGLAATPLTTATIALGDTNNNAIQDQLTRVVPLPAALPVGVAMLVGMAVVRKVRRRA
jgi:hypothetical protein